MDRRRLATPNSRQPRAARPAPRPGRQAPDGAPRRHPLQGLRYLDPTLAAYVGQDVTIRYDPRDLGEIRVFHRNRFLCRAISPEHAGQALTLKDIQTARTAHRRALRSQLDQRRAAVSEYLPPYPAADPRPPSAPPPQREPRDRQGKAGQRRPRRPEPRLLTYLEDKA